MFIDRNIQQWYRIKAMPLEEFVAITKLPNAVDVYNAIQKAIPGHIKITKDGTGDVHYGYTPGFGEGVSCYMATASHWYTTSVIQKINWDEKYFITLNSKYWFEFEPFEEVEGIPEENPFAQDETKSN